MLKYIAISVLIPIALSALLFFYISRPCSSTTLSINVDSPVTITRDNYGVPHIKAESMKDMLYALGYSMCQDRMWQIDMIRRLSTGRMSELFGENTLEMDKLIRNLKIPISAKEDVQDLPADTIKACSQFVLGINDAAARVLPLEYYLTWSKWENITILDVQSSLYFVSLFLSNIWGSDALKVQLRKTLGEGIEYLIPADVNIIKPENFAIDNNELYEQLKGPAERLKESDFNEFLEFYTELFDEGTGSNAWVISGKHTKSGKPILSNDVHLSPTVPSLWYMYHYTVGNYSQYSGSSIGQPMPILGRNKDLAWGTTSLKIDDIDLFAERPVNSTHYLFGDTHLMFQEFEETIKIKGKNSQKIVFKETIHGPILANSIAGVRKVSLSYGTLSANNIAIKWAALGHKDKSLVGADKGPGFKTIEDYKSAIYNVKNIRLSMVAASITGDIAFFAVGKIPIKSYKGDKILPGWKPETMWKGYVELEDMPYIINPEKGFIVTCNNFVTNSHYKYFESLGTYFSTARADRITEVLQDKIKQGHKFTATDQVEMLKDELDINARKIVPFLLEKVRSRYQEEVRGLARWDFVMRMDSKLPGIYAKWVIEISKGLLKGKISDELVGYFLRNQVMLNNIFNVLKFNYQEIRQFCDDPNTQKIENCEDLISTSFDKAVEYIGEKTWGDLHILTLKHVPFSESSLLKKIFEKSQPMGGYLFSIHSTYTNWNSTFAVSQGPGIKLICDMGNSSDNYWAVESGMSENLMSKHYSDMFTDFHYGDLLKFEV